MEFSDRLKQRIQAINDQVFKKTDFTNIHIKQIQTEVKKLGSWLDESSNSEPPSERIKDAVMSFRKTRELLSLREARLACWGIATHFNSDRYILIEDVKLFPKFLACIDNYRDDTKKFRRCYRGLLSCYFNYEPENEKINNSGKNNWDYLRIYLRDRINDIDSSKLTKLDWINTITDHKNLLSETPCDRYVNEFLTENDQSQFSLNQALQRLGITSSNSWVARTAILAVIKAAAECDNDSFKNYIPILLRYIGEAQNASILNEGLAYILERYSSIISAPIHIELQQFAVSHWKNPWLKINDSRWRLVSESTRRMVATWLKSKLVGQFFDLLSEDGCSDKRRFDFWYQYIDKMEVYFALGRSAMKNPTPDYVNLRKEMEGILFHLSGTDNAFIMKIGGYYFVELGKTGHATYIYQTIPFDISQSMISVSDLRTSRLIINKFRHKDNEHGYDLWEERFSANLFLNYKIKDSKDGLPEPWKSGNCLSGSSCGIKTIYAFCEAFELRCEDLRNNGGNLWVLSDDSNPIIKKQLEYWSFRFKQGRGWYNEWM